MECRGKARWRRCPRWSLARGASVREQAGRHQPHARRWQRGAVARWKAPPEMAHPAACHRGPWNALLGSATNCPNQSKYVFDSHLTRAEDEPVPCAAFRSFSLPVHLFIHNFFRVHFFCTSLLIPVCILCSRLTSRSRRGTDAPALSPPGKHVVAPCHGMPAGAPAPATRRARPATPRGAQRRATVLLAAPYQAWSPLCGMAKSRQRGGHPIFRAAAAFLCWTGCHSSAAVRAGGERHPGRGQSAVRRPSPLPLFFPCLVA